MLPNRLKWWWFALFTVVSSTMVDGSAESHGDSVLSRGLLENWRRKAKDEVRLFDRLPKNVERSYTPVSLSKKFLPTIAFYNRVFLPCLTSAAANHQASWLPSRDSPCDDRRWVHILKRTWFLNDNLISCYSSL